jgi:AcrR family transcriptional regulator
MATTARKNAPVRLELPKRPRARRTHAERRAETRGKILAAVVDSIAEHGFQRTTAQTISARAGVTWGAVQHQFGGKDGLLLAVLEDSFNRFAERMQDIGPGASTLDERASQFVDRAWEHYRSKHFRSTFEILLSYLGRDEHADAGDWRGQMARAWDGLWSRVFADAEMTRAKSLALQNFTISALTGLAQTAMLAGPAARTPKAELELLKTTLANALRAKE